MRPSKVDYSNGCKSRPGKAGLTTGRGGWTWYTGAAGWTYRLIVETLLGLKLEVDRLRIAPCMPAHWDTYKIHYRYRETIYHITVRRVGVQSGRIRVTMDGKLKHEAGLDESGQLSGVFYLVDDHSQHHVEVELN